RVNHQRRGSDLAAGLAEQGVNDGQEIGQALARAGAASNDVTAARTCPFQRLDLVLVQVERLAVVGAEDVGGLAANPAAAGQLVYRRGPLVRWADLQQRVGPQSRLVVERAIDEFTYVVGINTEERPHEVAVVGKYVAVQIEDAHVLHISINCEINSRASFG